MIAPPIGRVPFLNNLQKGNPGCGSFGSMRCRKDGWVNVTRATLEFRTPLALGLCAFLTLLICVAVLGLVSRTPAGWAAAMAPLGFILPAAIVARRIGWPWRAGLGAPFVIPVFICALLNSTLVTLRHGGIRWREPFYSLDVLRAGGVR